MSGPWSARPPWWDIGRAGHRARIAGVNVAPVGAYPCHVGKRLVFEPFPWGAVAVYLEPPGRPGFDGIDRSGRGALGPAPGRGVRTQAILGRQF